MGVQVLGSRIWLVPKKVEKKTSSGIILPDDPNTKVNAGAVKFVGTKVDEVKEGDMVMFGTQVQEIEKDNVLYYMMDIENVTAII